MKRFLGVISVIAVLSVGVFTVNATWQQKVTLNGKVNYHILADNLEGEMHSTLYAHEKNMPTIRVKNTFKRQVLGKWTDHGNTTFKVSELYTCYNYNPTLKNKAITRSYWENVDAGTRVIADLYIDPGHV